MNHTVEGRASDSGRDREENVATVDDSIEQTDHMDHNSNSDDDKSEHYVIVQLGANWIHCLNPVNNPMAQLAKELNYSLQVTSSDDDPGDDVLLYCRNKSRRIVTHNDNDDDDYYRGKNDDVHHSDHMINNEADGSNSTIHSLKVSKEIYAKALARYQWMKEYLDAYCANHYTDHDDDDHDNDDYDDDYNRRASMDHAPPLYDLFEAARFASERVMKQQSYEDVMVNNYTTTNNDDDDDDRNGHRDNDHVDDMREDSHGSHLFGRCSPSELSVMHWLYDRIAIDLGTSLRDASAIRTYMEGEL